MEHPLASPATHCRHWRQWRQMIHSPNYMTLLPNFVKSSSWQLKPSLIMQLFCNHATLLSPLLLLLYSGEPLLVYRDSFVNGSSPAEILDLKAVKYIALTIHVNLLAADFKRISETSLFRGTKCDFAIIENRIPAVM